MSNYFSGGLIDTAAIYISTCQAVKALLYLVHSLDLIFISENLY